MGSQVGPGKPSRAELGEDGGKRVCVGSWALAPRPVPRAPARGRVTCTPRAASGSAVLLLTQRRASCCQALTISSPGPACDVQGRDGGGSACVGGWRLEDPVAGSQLCPIGWEQARALHFLAEGRVAQDEGLEPGGPATTGCPAPAPACARGHPATLPAASLLLPCRTAC